ncbi:MAG TPA: hypothetical protein VN673_13820, partial [Clostridia bacterium]|nr:hypothetical protein [Clostridia bacterium]
TRDAFGQPLRDALSGTNKAALDSALQQLAAATPPEAATQSNRAAQARDELQKLSQAFEKSQPDALKLARQKDALKPDAKNSFNQGMAELDSMVQQMEKDSAPPAQDQMKQGRQALSNLQTGMRSLYGDNEAGNRLLARLDQMLQTQALEVGDLKKLLDQLHRFSVENAEKLSREKEKAELANVDPDRLAPTYRDRIQKYFQRLSER